MEVFEQKAYTITLNIFSVLTLFRLGFSGLLRTGGSELGDIFIPPLTSVLVIQSL